MISKRFETFLIKTIHEGYGYPIWAVKTALKVNGGNTDKALKLLEEIYSVMGDHPDVVIKRNEDRLKEMEKSYG